jgi:hypothetical protein
MKLPFKLWSDDKNKKVYRIVHTYQLTVEQYVKANNRDEAFDICLDKGGIIHDKINRHLTNEDFEVCETTYVDADPEHTDVKYVGTIIENEEQELECDTLEPESKNSIIPFNKKFGRHA